MLTAAVSLLLPVAFTACSGDAAPESTSSDTASPSQNPIIPPAPEDIEDPEQAAIAAYERYWRTVAEATAIPDPGYAPLAEVASGSALETAQSLAQAALDAGERDTGAPTHDAAVTEVFPEEDPYRFVVTDCSDSSAWVTVDADTGEPVEGEEYGKRHVEALVEHSGGRWLVTEVVVEELDSC